MQHSTRGAGVSEDAAATGVTAEYEPAPGTNITVASITAIAMAKRLGGVTLVWNGRRIGVADGDSRVALVAEALR
jgi:hypothetical protein